jgi:DNA invertase Pin-like site-specific DNA recombinase
MERFVGLVRVSTERQGESRLGLESGHAELARYVASVNGTLITVLEEVESGTHDDIVDRPTLLKALTLCKRHKAILLSPRVDRMIRSTCVHTDIKRSGVRIRFADNPNATEVIIDIQAALSADAGRKISETTTNALQAYIAGKRISKRLMAILTERYGEDIPQHAIDAVAGKLGSHLVGCKLTDQGRAKGRAKGNVKQAKDAREVYADLIDDIRKWHADGLSLRGIATRLNEQGQVTRTGLAWSHVQVRNLLKRAS